MNSEQLELLCGSTVRHGLLSDRAYVSIFDQDDPSRSLNQALDCVDELVALHNYSKILVMGPARIRQKLEADGYATEAVIPKLYRAEEDGLFMARYNHPDRLVDHSADRVQRVMNRAKEIAGKSPVDLADGYEYRLATPADSEQVAALYQQLFSYYQTPIDDPGYLSEAIASNQIYAGIWGVDGLLAVAAAKQDRNGCYAELSGFATQVKYQGFGFANYLLRSLEKELSGTGIKTGFTLARAPYFGMNIVAAQQRYQYAGTLVKNEKYSAGLESVNVWYKPYEVNR